MTAKINSMKKFNLFSLRGIPALAIAVLLMAAACSRSPYNFVKVQPKPFAEAAPASHAAVKAIPAGSLKRSSGESGFEFTSPSIRRQPSKAVIPAAGAESKPATASVARKGEKDKTKNTGSVVNRELKKSAAFGALPAKQLKKVEKIITRQADRLAEKKAAAAAAPVGFNQWMKIGVILLLIGLVVGIAFADLGYIVAVIGVVFLVLGLIQQL